MSAHQPALPGRPAWRRPLLWTVAALLPALALSALAAWRWRGPVSAPVAADPRLSYPTPYRNVRPEVAYVGDAACAGCHPSHARTYHRHPMGRSFARAAEVANEDRYDQAAHNPFEKFGFDYRVERRGDRVFHREIRPGPGGRPVYEIEAEVRYTIGSGTRGRSYLIDRDGYLFQSPISWFAQKDLWDISPGFSAGQHFERPIETQCLFCHANDATPVEHTFNRYRAFTGRAIGCERCHGPGELHVRQREGPESAADPDDTIVNPAHLEPTLREAVCQQCHLEGEVRILRRGRGPFDYRPGLPLHLFWSVFVRLPELVENQVVGQVEQMEQSRCFRAADGKLGCVSCHDPHVLPEPKEKMAYYRSRCLHCHDQKGCSLPAAVRLEKNGDACTACHMPRLRSSDIAHTAITDHRVPRRAAGSGQTEPHRTLDPGENPLLYFQRALQDPLDREIARDLALAQVQLARQRGRAAAPLARLALPVLEGAVFREPDDVAAWEARGLALWLEGRATTAMESYAAALERAPEREQTLQDAALLAEQMGRPDEAIDYWHRVVRVNPWQGFSRYHLARLLAGRRDWDGALTECRAVLRLNPAHQEARKLLIECHLRKGEVEQARAELDVLLASRPDNPDGLRRWFAEQSR
jgi:Tfp pilus assembly protein PilF